jgi:DNA-directed RNA polymerase specialized sigma24 family protein
MRHSFYLDNLTYEEISGILGIHKGTVKSNVSRGVEKLRINATLSEKGE